MLTAASVMMSASAMPGTSMTKQWLMRRAVRSPVSRLTTAPISSSVCRLPFISASALPSRTSSTAAAAEAWLCGASTISKPEISMPCCLGHRLDARARPDQDRRDQARLRRIDGARSELSSHGCATAVRAGGSALQRAIRRSYFSCLRSMVSRPSL